MRKSVKISVLLIATTLIMSSCHSSKQIVGKGDQGLSYHKQWNHYMLYGLVETKLSDPEKMAGTGEHYTITTKQTFVNGLLAVLTLGIYTPTETTVSR